MSRVSVNLEVRCEVRCEGSVRNLRSLNANYAAFVIEGVPIWTDTSKRYTVLGQRGSNPTVAGVLSRRYSNVNVMMHASIQAPMYWIQMSSFGSFDCHVCSDKIRVAVMADINMVAKVISVYRLDMSDVPGGKLGTQGTGNYGAGQNWG